MGNVTDVMSHLEAAYSYAPGINSSVFRVIDRAQGMKNEESWILAGGLGMGGSSYGLVQPSRVADIIKCGSGQMSILACNSAQDKMGGGGGLLAGQQQAADTAVTAYLKGTQLAVPDFGGMGVAGAGAAPGTTAPASTGGSTINVKSGDDEDEDDPAVTKADKKKFIADLRTSGYSPAEAEAIYEKVKAKAGGKEGEMQRMLSGLPSKRENSNWHTEFARWYGENIGDLTQEKIDGLVNDKVGGGDATLKLKRDKSVGGNDQGAVVEADCPALGLSAGDEISRNKDSGEWYREVDGSRIEGLEGAPPSADGESFELTTRGEINEDAKNCKDATSFMKYLDGSGFATPAEGAEGADGAAASGGERSVAAFESAFDDRYADMFEKRYEGDKVILKMKNADLFKGKTESEWNSYAVDFNTLIAKLPVDTEVEIDKSDGGNSRTFTVGGSKDPAAMLMEAEGIEIVADPKPAFPVAAREAGETEYKKAIRDVEATGATKVHDDDAGVVYRNVDGTGVYVDKRTGKKRSLTVGEIENIESEPPPEPPPVEPPPVEPPPVVSGNPDLPQSKAEEEK